MAIQTLRKPHLNRTLYLRKALFSNEGREHVGLLLSGNVEAWMYGTSSMSPSTSYSSSSAGKALKQHALLPHILIERKMIRYLHFVNENSAIPIQVRTWTDIAAILDYRYNVYYSVAPLFC